MSINTESLKAQLSIADVIGRSVALKRQGKHLVGLCPFHAEKSPSFKVDTNRQSFTCYGCGMFGDVIDFTRQIEGISFPAAVQRLSLDHGIQVNNQWNRKPEIRFTAEEITRAEFFAIGFAWHLEEYLGVLCELLQSEEPSPNDFRIYNTTRLLRWVRNCSTRDLAQFFLAYRRLAPKLVGRCIHNAEQFQQDFAGSFMDWIAAA